jgi:hypothetical protein
MGLVLLALCMTLPIWVMGCFAFLQGWQWQRD